MTALKSDERQGGDKAERTVWGFGQEKSHKSKGESCFKKAEGVVNWKELEYASTQMPTPSHLTVPAVS